MLRLEYQNYTLDFKFEAGTSRGVLRQHPIYVLKLTDSREPLVYGLGEAAPLERLSVETFEGLAEPLAQLREEIKRYTIPQSEETALRIAAELVGNGFPSLRFALETALLDLMQGGKRKVFENAFYNSQQQIPINGLIWMNNLESMKREVNEKLRAGFTCIKIKVGALDFEQELELIRYIRTQNDSVMLRLDANGGFPTNEVFARIQALTPFQIHSIEQPIAPRQPEAMALICSRSTIPIALDEELIGVKPEDRLPLLQYIKPQYLILKPTLLGGFAATREWIKLAERLGIGWWLTSALESNIGLNAISQFAADYPNNGFQGLGTGQLYHNNFESPLTINGEQLSYRMGASWDFQSLES